MRSETGAKRAIQILCFGTSMFPLPVLEWMLYELTATPARLFDLPWPLSGR